MSKLFAMSRTALLAMGALLACHRSAPPTPSASAAPARSGDSAPKPSKLPGAVTEVHADHGNIIATDAQGHVARLTSTGWDSDPVLSPEARRVLFLRKLADVPSSDPPYYRHDVYLVRTDDGEPPEVIVADEPTRSVHGDGRYPWMTGLNTPEFFPDGRRIAISIDYLRGEGIVTVDLETKKVVFIAAAFGHDHVLIPRGPHAGDFVLDLLPDVHSGDECWLVDGMTGKKKRNLTSVDPRCVDTQRMRAALQY